MVKKSFWLKSQLILLAIGLGALSWFLLGNKSALASQADFFSPATEAENRTVIDVIRMGLQRNAPAPPLGKASMSVPVILAEANGESHLIGPNEKWIDVDLSEQKVTAFEGSQAIRTFIISSGLPGTPTVTGTFRIRAKVRSQTMSGPGYSLPNVEWVQYFFSDYAFHGAYWHNNFGNPMSRGCINMTNEDAKWLFDWTGPEWNGTPWMHVPAGEGTLVVVRN
ncbi:MAG: L,D-transpeptidase [Caldilineaceae bacterium]|nr:L,D-transpeptidase [Caldilineaceae bacterium]